MASVARPSRGFAPLLAAVAMLSMATAILRLKGEAWVRARSDVTRPPTAMVPEPMSLAASPDLPPLAAAATGKPTRPREPTSLTAAAATEAPDLSSPAAAGARAKTVVARSFGAPNAKILEPVIAKRIGDGSSTNGAKHPRYQTEVVVEIPRGGGTPIHRQCFLTLQYVGGGEWQVEGMKFATEY
jgi:hypothetical protein